MKCARDELIEGEYSGIPSSFTLTNGRQHFALEMHPSPNQ
jgi:hypothetical protein